MKEKAEKNKGGRPPKINEEVVQAIILSVRKYLSIEFCAEAEGFSRSTVRTWLARGLKEWDEGIDSIYSQFSRGIKKARAEFIQDSIETLRSGDKNWQSTAWLLERCCAEEFGKDAEMYKQLLEDYKMLMHSLVDQKGVSHGRES